MTAYERFIKFLEKYPSDFNTKLYSSGGYFEVTNSTGNPHDIGFHALLSAFEDLLNNYDFLQKYFTLCNKESSISPERAGELKQQAAELSNINLDSYWKYAEKPLRLISEQIFTNSRIRVVGKEQTKVLFNILSKILACANNLDTSDFDEKMIFTQDHLNKAKEFLQTLMSQFDVHSPQQTLVNQSSKKGRNIIFYGAPGTGKSYQIDQIIQGVNYRRTVFHADAQNSDFIGMLKPYIDENQCSYIFMPGPFIQSYIDALKQPQIHHYLIIEELNRAHAAMVFGEIFQLLDRDENGVGHYKIEPADQSLIDYLKNELSIYSANPLELQMPGNLSILATMNSSDQAVMPLDTAFKRRWEFEYIQIDMGKASENNIQIPHNNQMVDISWRKLATEINDRLSENNIPEDRHLGPFFLSKSEINEKGITNKLFIYLWDDLLRHQSKAIIFNPEIKTFGQLIRYFQETKEVFCLELQEKLF